MTVTGINLKTLAIALLIFSLTAASAAAGDYPARPVTDVVVWGQGSRADGANRLVGAEMARILGVELKVINRVGGVAGSWGLEYAFSRPADGYTLCGFSDTCAGAAVRGGWPRPMAVWEFMIIGGSPDVVAVPVDSPHQRLADLLRTARLRPGRIAVAASGRGSREQLNLLALEKGAGIDFKFEARPGPTAGIRAAVRGEATAVIARLADLVPSLTSGRLRPLAGLIDRPLAWPGGGPIPSAYTDCPGLAGYPPLQPMVGLAVRRDAPDQARRILAAAFQRALAGDKVKAWAQKNLISLTGLTGQAAAEAMDRLESRVAWGRWYLGAAKVDPGDLGIPKP